MKSRQSTLLAVLVTTLVLTAGTAACDPMANDEATGSEPSTAAPATPAATRAPAEPAPAEPAAFLEIADLPQSVTGDPWTGTPVTSGGPGGDDPEPCPFDLPPEGVRHRRFMALTDTLTQVVVTSASETAAEELVTGLEQTMRSCAERRQQTDHDGFTYTVESFGKLDVEDGAAVYSFTFTPPPTEATEGGGRYWGVGRDGDTVTLTTWGLYGGLEGASVDAFKKTAVTSVAKLYG